MSILLLLGGSGTPSYPLNETFDGASGAPNTALWTVTVVGGATVALDTDRLKIVTPSPLDVGQALLANILPADVELRASYTFTIGTNQTPGFNFRGDGVWQGSGNRHLFTNGLSFIMNTVTNVVALFSTNSSSSSALGSGLSLTIGATDTVHLHVVTSGTSVQWKAWLNSDAEPGVWQSATDSSHVARTRLGLALQSPTGGAANTAYWDNIVAHDPGGFTATLAETLANTTVAASGGFGATGTTTRTLANVTSAASGGYGTTGSLAETLDPVTATATGHAYFTGTVARTLANVTGAASGGSSTGGTLTENLDAVVVQASGGLGVTGTVARTLDELNGVASGAAADIAGTVAVTLDAVETAAPLTDETGDPITDESGNPILVRGAEGSHGIGGTLAVTLANIVSTATGAVVYSGSVTETLDDVTLAAEGTSGLTGALTETLENLTSTAAGVVGASGDVAEALDNVTSAADGDHDPVIIAGNVAVTLAAVTSTAAGSTVVGTASETFDDATSAAAGTFTITGSLAVTLADVTAVTAGAPGTTGTVDRTLNDIIAAGEGSTIAGTVDETLDDVTSATAGTVTIVVFGIGQIDAIFQAGPIASVFDTGRVFAVAGSRR